MRNCRNQAISQVILVTCDNAIYQQLAEPRRLDYITRPKPYGGSSWAETLGGEGFDDNKIGAGWHKALKAEAGALQKRGVLFGSAFLTSG